MGGKKTNLVDLGEKAGDAKYSDFVRSVAEWLEESPTQVEAGVLIYRDETGIHYVAGQIENKAEALGLLEFGKFLIFEQGRD